MSETTFRTATPQSFSPVSTATPPDPSNVGANLDPENLADIEPLSDRESRGTDIVLESLGIEENIHELPQEAKENITETNLYVKSIMKSRGLEPTIGNFKTVLEDIKQDMGLDTNVDPSILLERIGGVVSSWKELSFIKDAREKRTIFSKLMRANDASEMNKIVFEEMERKHIWR